MNKKLTLLDVQRYLREQILRENEETSIIEGNDSLDSQVDRLLMSYISDASNATSVKEAEEKSKVKDSGPTKKSIQTLDIRTLCGSVSNLIDNIDNLIEFKNTILRRTINTLNKTYDQTVVRQFEIIMEDEFSLVVGKSNKDLEDEIVIPTADRAGPVS